MSFTVGQLLLPEDRQSQLTAALANADYPAPLTAIIAEAEARVDQQLSGLDYDTAQRNALVRAFTLYTAYSLVGQVPKDIDKLYADAKEMLTLLAETEEPSESTGVTAGNWGSNDVISSRR